ncbi:MAG: DUF885 domain-containing protein [Myxococcales bacterium]
MAKPACLAALLCAASCATPPIPKAPPLAVSAQKPVVAPEPFASEQLRAVADGYWTALLATAPLPMLGEGGLGGPLAATALGDHRFDGKLDDLSPAAHTALIQSLDRLRTEADTLAASGLSAEEGLTLRILRAQLAEAHEAEVCQGHLWLVDQMNGVQVTLPQTHLTFPLGTAKGASELAARYGEVGRLFDQRIAALREGLAKKLVAPRTNVTKVLEQLRDLLSKDAAHSIFLPPAERFAGLPKSQRGPARDAVRAAIASSVLPGLARYAKFLEAELLPKARADVGLWALPQGEACYAFLARYHTGLSTSAQELHELGKAELARIEAEEEALAKGQGAAVGKDGRVDLRAFSDALARRREQIKKDPEELLEWNRATLARAAASLPRAFSRMPPRPIETRPIEAYRAAASTPAFYQPAPDDGSQPAIYYVNTSRPETRTLFNEEALCFHETVPGHHLQISIAQELQGLPDFRRQTGQTAYVEGWALYSERMADETLQLYSGPLARYGMLGYQAWRAARLVVDTGMHALHWDRDRAIAFLRAHTTLSPSEAANEIDRYVTMPGQALAYLVGELEIFRLRRAAEQRLGDRFELKEFHDVLLTHGALPLPEAGRLVFEWLDRKAEPKK